MGIIPQLNKEGVVGWTGNAFSGVSGRTLEPEGSHKVNHPLVAINRSCDSTKAGRVKLRVAIGEVCIVENIDERRLDFKVHRLPNREPLCDAHISIEEPAAVQAVHREIAKRTWIRLSQQSWF